ncbi:MAG: hypothetical protein KIT62_16330 [Cyclobacteriaceae bacterium]|nr:hypothetical protein [Cyclobacteriaceae bacterium]
MNIPGAAGNPFRSCLLPGDDYGYFLPGGTGNAAMFGSPDQPLLYCFTDAYGSIFNIEFSTRLSRWVFTAGMLVKIFRLFPGYYNRNPPVGSAAYQYPVSKRHL